MIKNIKDLDEPGQRLKVLWAKANNFFNNFTLEYLPIRESLVKGEYGSDWTNVNTWMLRKVGISDQTVFDALNAFKRSYAASEREQLEQLEKERIAVKRREKEEKAVEAARLQRERAIAQLAKNAAAENKKRSQAAWDAWKAEVKVEEDAQKKRDATNEKRRKTRKTKKSDNNKQTTKTTNKSKMRVRLDSSTTGNGTTLTTLADNLRVLHKRETNNRNDWIEITLAIASVLKEAKDYCGDNTNRFHEWFTENGFDTWINKDDRAAYIGIGGMEYARSVLEQTARKSVRYIWEKDRFRYVANSPSEEHISEQNQGDSVH